MCWIISNTKKTQDQRNQWLNWIIVLIFLAAAIDKLSVMGKLPFSLAGLSMPEQLEDEGRFYSKVVPHADGSYWTYGVYLQYVNMSD